MNKAIWLGIQIHILPFIHVFNKYLWSTNYTIGAGTTVQWVTIAKGLELLDTPGGLWPKFEDPEVGFCLAATGAIKEDVFDREDATELLVERLMERYPEELKSKYAVEFENSDDVKAVLAKIATSRGCIKAGGVLDLDRVIQTVLRDFRSGRLGRFTLDEP